MLAQVSPQRRKSRRGQRSGLKVVQEALEDRLKVRIEPCRVALDHKRRLDVTRTSPNFWTTIVTFLFCTPISLPFTRLFR